ncbi:MAG: nucleolar RNA-binding Nop10p family protein [Nanoarchaeota archaeon]
MRLRKCNEHGYSLKETCGKCGKKTIEAHYKFVRVGSAAKVER